jgi:PleD family two-component response regulator
MSQSTSTSVERRSTTVLETVRQRVFANDVQMLVYRHGSEAAAVESVLEEAGYVLVSAEAAASADLDLLLVPSASAEQELAACQALFQKFTHVPILLLTGQFSSEHLVQARRAGARDFLPQPSPDIALVTRIEDMVARRRVQDELGRREQELTRAKQDKQQQPNTPRNLFFRDRSTGALSRSALEQQIRRHIVRGRLDGVTFSLVHLSFAEIDALQLRRLVDLLWSLVREDDLVARLEDSAVVLLLPATDTYGAGCAARRMSALIEQKLGLVAESRITSWTEQSEHDVYGLLQLLVPGIERLSGEGQGVVEGLRRLFSEESPT